MHRIPRRKSLFTALFLALPLLAQAQAPVLEEVIVTAQRRTESLQDVPVSVSAIRGDLIKRNNFV